MHPVNEGGCLTILGDDVKYSSLFWESKRMTNAGQNSRVNIDLDQSVIGSVATVLESLSNNLRAMSMSDTAATDFMQYWIPALTRMEKADNMSRFNSSRKKYLIETPRLSSNQSPMW